MSTRGVICGAAGDGMASSRVVGTAAIGAGIREDSAM